MQGTTLVSVPEGGTTLDVLAQRCRAAFDKMQGGRAQWIEGTLELAAVVAEARERPELASNAAFSRWLYQHGLNYLSPNDRVALLGFCRDPKTSREMLEQSNSTSWRVIWENRAKRSQAAPIKNDKSRRGEKTGSQKRKYIPTVMRDDVPPPPVRKGRQSQALTP